MSKPADTPKPLSEWIYGTLTMHFAGATIQRRMRLAEAHDVQQILNDTRSGDSLDWAHHDWFQFDETKVLACEFEADEDLGWPLTPEERKTLAQHGHHHGFLRTLRDHWHTQGREPSYTPLAMSALAHLALGGITGEQFIRLAERLEGETGHRTLDLLLVDDDAEPDDAPEPTSDTDQGEQSDPDATPTPEPPADRPSPNEGKAAIDDGESPSPAGDNVDQPETGEAENDES